MTPGKDDYFVKWPGNLSRTTKFVRVSRQKKLRIASASETGAVFVVLPKRIKKKTGKRGKRRGEGEGDRLES